MSKAEVGLIAVGSHIESGGERADEILREAKDKLESHGLEVETGERIIWDSADAINVAEKLSLKKLDLLVIIHATWVQDAIQYILVNTVRAPVVLWAVPFTETFSMACVQHFGSILWERGIFYKYVYGLPDDKEVISAIGNFASTAKAVRDLKQAKIGLLGPRQTWRICGPQDMTHEEWDFSACFGARIVHIEMEELIKKAEEKDETEATKVLQSMKQNNKLGKIEVDEGRLIYACKLYLGVKDLFEKYNLSAATAECYPEYGGLSNLPSSWLADENVILDTEGDVGHTTLMLIMQRLGKGGAVALAETGRLDFKGNYLCLAHEGSSGHSLAEAASMVHVMPAGEKGTTVGFPLKAMPEITVASLCGKKNTYRMLIANGRTKPITEKEWLEIGKKLMVKLSFECDIKKALEVMRSQGIDHHLALKEGDLTAQLIDLCDLLGVRKICL